MSNGSQDIAVNKGFSKIYEQYETFHKQSIIDQSMRFQVYKHIERFLKPNSHILELNSGSGIDALYFANKGHEILATDIAEGSKAYIEAKILKYKLKNLTFKTCSFHDLNALNTSHFDYVFSNFGGLNCTNELDRVINSLNDILKKDTMITFVIMGKYYPWDWIYALKGKFRRAFIRFNKDGIYTNIEGEAIKTFYHSPKKVKTKMAKYFEFIDSENLGVFYPSVNHTSLTKYKKLINRLISIDSKIAKWKILPTGIGDYYILTFKKH